MKCLSIKQPWAEFILSGRKRIEIRTWNTNFRGNFLIHTGKHIDLEACERFLINPKSFITGAVVGIAELTNVKEYICEEHFIGDKYFHMNPPEWFEVGSFGFIIKDARRIKPISLKGKLGFFETNLFRKMCK